MKRVDLLNVGYDNLLLSEALPLVVEVAKSASKANVFFLNADCAFKARKDEEYAELLRSADFVLPDGIGVRLVSRLFGIRMRGNCNGTDFSPLLVKAVAQEGLSVFLLGGERGVAEKAKANLEEMFPGVRIVGCNSGFFEEDEIVVKRINDSGADILFVAMGVPVQEKWISRNRHLLRPSLCLGVGALFDYLSGRIPRAPLFFRRCNVEWVWRIFVEPKRMFIRYIVNGVRFVGYVFQRRFFSE